MSELIVGKWRNGMDKQLLDIIEEIEDRAAKGFRLLPNDLIVKRLAEFLDGYDFLASLLLDEDPTNINIYSPIEVNAECECEDNCYHLYLDFPTLEAVLEVSEETDYALEVVA